MRRTKSPHRLTSSVTKKLRAVEAVLAKYDRDYREPAKEFEALIQEVSHWQASELKYSTYFHRLMSALDALIPMIESAHVLPHHIDELMKEITADASIL